MIGDWGPFNEHIDQAERITRLRALRAICNGLARSAHELIAALKAAEADPAALLEAADQFEALPSIARRKVLAAYLQMGDR
jgi:hypothetical protein